MKEQTYSMNWFYRSWFYWGFTALMLIAGIVLTIMLIISDKITNWYGYIIGPAFLLAGLVQILWYFITKKNESKKVR